jgi:hypothetical protein
MDRGPRRSNYPLSSLRLSGAPLDFAPKLDSSLSSLQEGRAELCLYIPSGSGMSAGLALADQLASFIQGNTVRRRLDICAVTAVNWRLHRRR